MRRMTVVLLVVFLLATVIGAATPVWAQDGRRGHNRDRFVERDYRRVQFAGYGRGYSAGYRRGAFGLRGRDPYLDPYNGYWGYRHDPYYARPHGDFGGGGRGYFYGYRRSHFLVVPRNVVVIYPEYVTVVRPVVYDDVVLLPHYRYRVVERYPDRFLLIFGTGNLTVILRG